MAAGTEAITGLYDRGVLRRLYKPRDDALPGEVGSGYKSGANLDHVEPEEIFLLGTSHIAQRSADDVLNFFVSLRCVIIRKSVFCL